MTGDQADKLITALEHAVNNACREAGVDSSEVTLTVGLHVAETRKVAIRLEEGLGMVGTTKEVTRV